MKKTFIITLLLILAVSLTACGNKQEESSAKIDPNADWNQIANPFVDCSNIEDAEKIAGFTFAVPESFDGYSETYISAIDKFMLQVIYANGDEDEICLRKAVGCEDVSGDYNVYEKIEDVEVGGQNVIIKGNGEAFNLATWVIGDHAYSLRIAQAVEKDVLCDMVKKVLE